MKNALSLLRVSTFSLVTFSLVAVFGSSQAIANTANTTNNEQVKQNYTKSKKVPAMRNRVYTQLARAQKLADDGDKAAGFAVLAEVEARITSLNAYEQAMLYNFLAFMHYGNDDLNKAIVNFNKVISDETVIPDSLLLSTRYSLAQLSMQQQDYAGALTQLIAWQQANPKALTANQEMLFAQIYYQDKRYAQTLTHVEQAITLRNQENKLPKENWLILQRASYYELNQPKKVTQVMEQLVRWYDKPQYWLQLSGMYGEIGEEDKQLAVMEAAYQAGYVTQSSDIMTLAQLYQYHGAPFKTATLLDEAIEQGVVVAQEKSLAMLSRAYLAAKEPQKAINVLMTLTEFVEGGKYEALLAQIYLNDQQWAQAVTFADKAITKSVHDNDEHGNDADYLGNMYLAKGMANFNLKQFEPALQAFANAQQRPKLKKTAQQWLSYVEREHEVYQKQQQIRLAMLN